MALAPAAAGNKDENVLVYFSSKTAIFLRIPFFADFYWFSRIYQRGFIDLLWYFVTTDLIYARRRKRKQTNSRRDDKSR